MDHRFLVAAVFVAGISITKVIYASDIIELTYQNFNDEVLNSDAIWLISFYSSSCDNCKDYLPELSDAAALLNLKGIVKAAAVNVDSYDEVVNRFGIKLLPAIKIFGADKNNPQAYEGGRSVQSIVEDGLRLKGSNEDRSMTIRASVNNLRERRSDGMVTLDNNNFEDLVYNSEYAWFVYVYAPWCGHCKNFNPTFSSVASSLKSTLTKVAILDGDENKRLTSELGVSGFPSFRYFRPHSRGPSDAIEYSGGRSSEDIIAWTSEQLQEN